MRKRIRLYASMRACRKSSTQHWRSPGGLIAEEREDAIVFENALDVGAASFFGQHVLAGAAAEIVYESVEEAIVECASDRVSGKAEQAHQVAAELEIAEVAGNEDERPTAKERADELLLIDDVRMFAPICFVNFAWRLSDFGDHQDKVPPHLPGDFVAFLGGHAGKGDAKILVDDVTANARITRAKKVARISAPARTPSSGNA